MNSSWLFRVMRILMTRKFWISNWASFLKFCMPLPNNIPSNLHFLFFEFKKNVLCYYGAWDFEIINWQQNLSELDFNYFFSYCITMHGNKKSSWIPNEAFHKKMSLKKWGYSNRIHVQWSNGCQHYHLYLLILGVYLRTGAPLLWSH